MIFLRIAISKAFLSADLRDDTGEWFGNSDAHQPPRVSVRFGCSAVSCSECESNSMMTRSIRMVERVCQGGRVGRTETGR